MSSTKIIDSALGASRHTSLPPPFSLPFIPSSKALAEVGGLSQPSCRKTGKQKWLGEK